MTTLITDSHKVRFPIHKDAVLAGATLSTRLPVVPMILPDPTTIIHPLDIPTALAVAALTLLRVSRTLSPRA